MSVLNVNVSDVDQGQSKSPWKVLEHRQYSVFPTGPKDDITKICHISNLQIHLFATIAQASDISQSGFINYNLVNSGIHDMCMYYRENCVRKITALYQKN